MKKSFQFLFAIFFNNNHHNVKEDKQTSGDEVMKKLRITIKTTLQKLKILVSLVRFQLIPLYVTWLNKNSYHTA